MQHHPLPEYPRPALRRDSYENLNGLWQYAITSSAGLPAKWDGDILVPYSPETKASGVGRTLQPGAWLHYHRSFVPPAGTGGRVLLHFGAVDYACAVQVNGHLVGGHRGGYWPFALDITDALNPAGHDRLWVTVQDPTGTGVQARGKQTLRPGGINRGHFITPHIVKEIEDNELDSIYRNPRYPTIDREYYEMVVKGMRAAVDGSTGSATCRMAGAILPGVEVCGKTGTAQNRGKDHSVFMGFAPMDNPKIAIAVYVENGGFGATYGVPIGAMMMDQYLHGKLSPENEIRAEEFSNRVILYGDEER